MTIELDRLQQDFLHAIHTHDASLIAAIAPKDTIKPSEQIAIYRQNTQATRCKTLQAIYPMTCAMLGEACFQTLAHYYTLDNPATDSNLNHYGAELPTYIDNPPQQFTALQDLPYLSDLSRLDYLLHRAYYTADRTAFPIEAFNALTPTQQTHAKLQLAPDISLLETPWPVFECWQHWQQGALPETLTNIETTHYLCIHRENLQPTISQLNAGAYRLLTQVAQTSLSALAKNPTLIDAMPLITEYIQRGWIVDFIVPTI